jgi:hypothetical protein
MQRIGTITFLQNRSRSHGFTRSEFGLFCKDRPIAASLRVTERFDKRL